MKKLEPGQQVEQFRIVRKLGQGGMSEVYLARDIKLGRKVALKIIRADLADSPQQLEIFLHEARLTAQFAHPHIIAIYSVGEFEGQPYLALEYLEGQTLEERMSEGAMSGPETVRIGLAIAQALDEAHSHGILHRDLKPANVIIPSDGRIRVLDFGISKRAEGSIHPPLSVQDSSAETQGENKQLDGSLGRTTSGTVEQWLEKTRSQLTYNVQGTPAYMAPERWRRKKTTSSVDIWALGVILYEMLAQNHPFLSDEQSIRDLAKRVILAKQPPALPQNVIVPAELSQLIASMLDSDPSRRPTSRTVVHVLQELFQRKRTQLLEKTNPFRGLLPFSERHSHLFFGRSAEIEMALERLRNETVLPVVGPSGAGKSSFVAAGVVPRLRELDRWLVLQVRPGTKPFEALGSIIQSGWKGDHSKFQDEEEKRSSSQEGPANASLRDFARALRQTPSILLLELQGLADQTQGKVLLFVDQLEELHTLEHDPDVRRAYMEAISRAADDPDGPIRVVFTIRDDFLGRVADTPSARKVLSRIMVLRAPGEDALEEIVRKPVELAGYSYEHDGLPQDMINAARDASASLPILQFACSQLWNRRDREKKLLSRSAYEEMGGVEGALANEADELLAGLSEVHQDVVRQIVLRLVTPQSTRRVLKAQELLDGLDSSAAVVLDRLTAARMVVSRRGLGSDSVEAELELVHDSLIHSWAPLVRWLEQSREEVVFLDEVSRAAELWESRGRPIDEVWSGGALDEALAKIKRCEVVPQRVTEFLDAAVLRRKSRARRRSYMRFAILGTLLAVITVLAAMNRQTEIQRGLAVVQRDRQQQAHARALREGACAAYTKGNYLEARSKLRASLEARDSIQARALAWLLLREPLVWTKSLGGFVNWASVSPNGRLIAASSSYGPIYLYDTKTLERRVLRGHKGQVRGIDFSADGRWLSSGADDREVRLWDLRESSVKVFKGHTNVVWTTAFSPDRKHFVSGSSDGTLIVWDIESGSALQTIKSRTGVFGVRYTADGRFMISVNRGEKVNIWNTQSYSREKIIEETGAQIVDAVSSADGKLLAYGSESGILFVRDLETGREITRISGNTRGIRSLSFSPDSDFIAAAVEDGRVLIWDTRTWSLHSQYLHSKNSLSSVAFLPDGEQFISTGNAGTLKLWKMGIHSFPKKGAGHHGPIYALAFDPTGKTLATGGTDGDIRFWNVAKGRSVRRIRGHDVPIFSVDFLPSGKILTSAADDGSIRLWNISDGELLKTLLGHRNAVTRVVASPDKSLLISSSYDKNIVYWDFENLIQIKTLTTKSVLNSIDIDPTGRFLASTGHSGTVEVRDIKTGQVLQTLSSPARANYSVAFSPDGKSLYSSGHDSTVRRYQLDSNSTRGEIVAYHHGNIYQIDVMDSLETLLGTPSADGTAKIWKVEKGTFITLKGHQNEVNNFKFSPDGSRAATVSDDGTLRLWDIKTGRPQWHAPLMLEIPLLLYTQKGLISFDADAQPLPSAENWQKALKARGKIASATTDQKTLCLVTYNNELEIWNIPDDERSSKSIGAEIDQVLAIRNGCLSLSAGTLSLTKTTGNRVVLAQHVDTTSRFEESVIVLQGGKVSILDLDGNQQEEFIATTGASSLTLVGDSVAIGFPDGNIEVWKREGSRSVNVLACREVETSPVTRMIPGPPSTIIAGFANGSIGIWSLETGERLYTQSLHGPVIHLLHRDQVLFAATELGSRMQLDLSTFYTEYCELMKRVWHSVPWVWEEGRPQFRERPSDHFCSGHQ